MCHVNKGHHGKKKNLPLSPLYKRGGRDDHALCKDFSMDKSMRALVWALVVPE